eukprot:445993-Rhodomonas_salina.3
MPMPMTIVTLASCFGLRVSGSRVGFQVASDAGEHHDAAAGFGCLGFGKGSEGLRLECNGTRVGT